MKNIIAIVMTLFWLSILQSQKLIYPIYNFEISDYTGGNQNWDIKYSNDRVYVANNDGLLEFDGIRWQLHELPNKTIVRSVEIIGDKIFTGSYEEFGYWHRQPNGTLRYYSLKGMLGEQESIDSESFWGIYKVGNQVIFKSFSLLIIYENNHLEYIKSEVLLLEATVANDVFSVFGYKKGLLELIDGKLKLIAGSEILANYKVQYIQYVEGEKIIVGIFNKGCLVYDHGVVSPLNDRLNIELKKHKFNTAIYANEHLYIGTISNGIYRYNLRTHQFKNISKKQKLPNNTVLGITIGDQDNIWVAMDNGISMVKTNTEAYYLFDMDIGAVHDLLFDNNNLYVATNTGVYRINKDKQVFIKNSQGHTWGLTKVGGQIICGHNMGTYRIDNDQFRLISSHNGGYTIVAIPQRENVYIQGNYAGLSLYQQLNSDWKIKRDRCKTKSLIIKHLFRLKNIVNTIDFLGI